MFLSIQTTIFPGIFLGIGIYNNLTYWTVTPGARVISLTEITLNLV
jgi:hypothetical protein